LKVQEDWGMIMSPAEYMRVPIINESDIVNARQAGREVAKNAGFRAVECAEIAAAISELARNIFLYANTGEVLIKIIQDHSDVIWIEVIAQDKGPGIEDKDLVMRDGYSTSKGLGLGLPGTKRIMDEFELFSEVGEGTRVTVRKRLTRRYSR